MNKPILEIINAGDLILIDGAIEGEVVFNSTTKSYSPDHPIEKWKPDDGYEGIMIVQENGALVFHSNEHLNQQYSSVEILNKA